MGVAISFRQKIYQHCEQVKGITANPEGYLNVARGLKSVVVFVLETGKTVANINLIARRQLFNPDNFSSLIALKPWANALDSMVNVLTIVELPTTIGKLCDPKLWAKCEKEKYHYLKVVGTALQVIQRSMDTFLLIPNKWNLIDLGKLCTTVGNATNLKFITPLFLTISKESIGLVASSLSLVYNIKDIAKQENIRNRKLELLTNLSKIKYSKAWDDEKIKEHYIAWQDRPNYPAKPKKPIQDLFNQYISSLLKQYENPLTNLLTEIERNKGKLVRRLIIQNYLNNTNLSNVDKEKLIKGYSLTIEPEKLNLINKAATKVIYAVTYDNDKAGMRKVIAYKYDKKVAQRANAQIEIKKDKIARNLDIAKIVATIFSLSLTTGLALTSFAAAIPFIAVTSSFLGLGMGLYGIYRTWNLTYHSKPRPFPVYVA